MREQTTILGPIEPLLRGIALVIWAFVGVTRFDGGPKLWLIPWVLYAVGTLLGAARHRLPQALNVAILAMMSASVLALPRLGLVGFEGMFLSFVVVQLPTVISMRASVAWAIAHIPLLLPMVWEFNNARQLMELFGAYSSFSTFALLVHYVRRREQRARAELAQSNASLLATRALVVEGSQQAERLRISRELHDSLGHHLVALRLQLDLAQRQATGPAAEALARARDIASGSLAEVRKAVSELQADSAVDVIAGLKALAAGVPVPKILIDAPGELGLDGELSHAVFRCVQEAITNAVKHAQAQYVWVTIRREGGALDITVRDDGAGAPQLKKGRGLEGITARVEAVGGQASFETGRGFTVRLKVPVPT